MGLFAHLRPVVAAFAVAGVLAGVASCDSGGGGVALPSTLPSVERTGRETPTATEPTTERTTRDTPTATATTTRTQDEAATTPANPTSTQPPPTTKTAAPPPTTTAAPPPTTTAAPPPTTRTTTTTTTPPTTKATSSPAASTSPAAATTTTDGIDGLGWLLIVLVIALVIGVAVLLVNRSRRTAAWQTDAATLAGAGRALIATRLPQVLSARDAQGRALTWPPLRSDLTEMSSRWRLLAGEATDDFHRDSAGQVSIMLQDLVTAVDAENEALAAGRDWQRISPQVDEIIRTLDATLTTFVAPAPEPGGAEPYPA